MDRQTSLIILGGPTASGKTALALRLAENFPIELISADSMQVYRHMDIATAKPTPVERDLLPHHLIDVVEPDQEFNAGEFAKRANVLIDQIYARGKMPIVVGGTGLYIKALVFGLAEVPDQDPELRAVLNAMAQTEGLDRLWTMLRRLDPECAATVKANDSVRILRSLEIIFKSGRRPSEIYREHAFRQGLYAARHFALMPQRDLLYENINHRTELMMDAGLIGETVDILERGFDRKLRSMQTLAYKHVVAMLDGDIEYERCVELIQRDTRHYAKRQITWFKNHKEYRTFDARDAAYDRIARELEALTGAD